MMQEVLKGPSNLGWKDFWRNMVLLKFCKKLISSIHTEVLKDFLHDTQKIDQSHNPPKYNEATVEPL